MNPRCDIVARFRVDERDNRGRIIARITVRARLFEHGSRVRADLDCDPRFLVDCDGMVQFRLRRVIGRVDDLPGEMRLQSIVAPKQRILDAQADGARSGGIAVDDPAVQVGSKVSGLPERAPVSDKWTRDACLSVIGLV